MRDAKKSKNKREASPGLLAVLLALPPDTVEQHFGGTAIHMLSPAFHAAFRDGFLLEGARWRTRPSAFVRTAKEWRTFISMTAPGADADPALHVRIILSEAERGNPGFAASLFAMMRRTPLKKRGSNGSRIALSSGQVVPTLCAEAASAGNVEMLDFALDKSYFFERAAMIRVALIAAAKTRRVEMCASMTVRYREASRGALVQRNYDAQADALVIEHLAPSDVAAYERGVGRPVQPEAYDIRHPALSGNVDMAAWMVETGRVPSWGNALRSFLVHDNGTGDAGLGTVRDAMGRGCPVTPDVYGRYSEYKTPERPSVAVMTAFYDLTFERPSEAFIVDALAHGHIEMADAFLIRNLAPSPEVASSRAHSLPVESLDWLKTIGVSLTVVNLDSVFRKAALDSVEWMYDNACFVDQSDLPFRCLVANNFPAFELMVEGKGQPYDARRLVSFTKGKGHLECDFAYWMLDNLPPRVSLEEVLAAVRAPLSFAFHLHKSGKKAQERYSPRICAYLDGLERLPAPEAREKCKMFGVTPKDDTPACVDALYRSFGLKRARA